MKKTKQNLYVECWICGHYHPDGFLGDCRDNENRYDWERVPAGSRIREYDKTDWETFEYNKI